MVAMSRVTRALGVFGVLIPIVVFSSVLVSISQSPWFSWSANALSDLGDPSMSGVTSIFNSGLIAGGALMMVFAVGLLLAVKRALSRVGAALLIVDAAFLSCIGIFTEATGNTHLYVSVAFFALLPLSLWLVGAGTILAGSKIFGALTMIIGLLIGLPWAFLMSFDGWAIPEAISAVVAFFWTAAEGIMLCLGRAKG